MWRHSSTHPTLMWLLFACLCVNGAPIDHTESVESTLNKTLSQFITCFDSLMEVKKENAENVTLVTPTEREEAKACLQKGEQILILKETYFHSLGNSLHEQAQNFRRSSLFDSIYTEDMPPLEGLIDYKLRIIKIKMPVTILKITLRKLDATSVDQKILKEKIKRELIEANVFMQKEKAKVLSG